MAEQLLGIRKYLQDNGYGDNDIGYSNGNVTLKGQNLIAANPQTQTDLSKGLYQDSTYATGDALKNALSGYQNTYGAPKLDNSNKMNNLNNNLYNNATQSPFEFKQQQSPFSYDANSDVQYQNALKGALANAQVASNNAQSQLGSRGIGNSSIASNMANQIQQKAVGDVTTNVLPSLIQQAYARYQDQNNNDYRNQVANYGAQQDQFRNQSALSQALNGLGQQEFSNNITQAGLTGYFNPGEQQTNAVKEAMARNSAAWANADPTEQQRLHAENLKLAASIGATDTTGNGDYAVGPLRTMTGQQLDYGKEQDAIKNGMSQQQIDNQAKQFAQRLGYDYDNMTAGDKQAWAQIAISQQNANTSAASAANSNQNARDRLTFDKEQASAKAVKPVTIPAKESANNFNTIATDLATDGLTKEQALELAQANVDYLTDSDYKKLLDKINKEF